MLAAGTPGSSASIDLETTVGKQGSDGVLDAIDSSVECLAILDQSSMLAYLVRGHMDRFEVPHHRQSSQLDGVVFVGLAFDVLPSPGLFIGAADQRLQAEFLAQVTDPAAGATGLHHYQVDLVVPKDGRQIGPRRGRIPEPVLLSLAIEETAHRVEFAQIDCKNDHIPISVVLG